MNVLIACEESLSRQAAIKFIRECAEAAHYNHEWDMEQGYLNAIECIEEEPAAQQHWNNLYETVPPEDGLYLVTVRIRCESADCVFVDVDTYRNGGFMTHSTNEDGVEAWMELPEPWRR